MTYKHQNDVIDAVDFMKPSYAEGKHKAIQAEVDEVYRKSEAFDAYHGTIQSHLHLKGEPEFSNPATEVLSDLIDIHDDYENKGGQINEQ